MRFGVWGPRVYPARAETAVSSLGVLRAHREDERLPLLAVVALLGMRRSEALGLKWSDVRSPGRITARQSRTAALRGGVRRGADEDEAVPSDDLPPAARLPLVRQARQQEQWREGVGRPVRRRLRLRVHHAPRHPDRPRTCTRQVRNACRRAGVREVRLHDFRHGCVSVLLELGVPPRTAMEIVGHTAMEMTMNVYGHVHLKAKRAAMDRVGDLFDDDQDKVTSKRDVRFARPARGQDR